MKIKSGNTRVIFLVGKFAIKIAKPRIMRLFFRMLFFPFNSQRNRKRYFEKYGNNLFCSWKKYLIFGILANSLEYSYSKKYYKDPDIMPVLEKYLSGWIIVQERGESINREDKFESPLIKTGIILSTETIDSHQYCLKDGKTFIVDYGDKSTVMDLIKTLSLRTNN